MRVVGIPDWVKIPSTISIAAFRSFQIGSMSCAIRASVMSGLISSRGNRSSPLHAAAGAAASYDVAEAAAAHSASFLDKYQVGHPDKYLFSLS